MIVKQKRGNLIIDRFNLLDINFDVDIVNINRFWEF